MGEAPIYSCKAHVFTIDPKTKKTWLPASSQAIKVSFFFDKSRELYRILSIDEAAQDPAKKMTINSIVSDKMSFKKTSLKFGQWADPASGAVYGLGFANEAELDRFVEQFCQALDHTRRLRKQQQQQQQQQPGDFGDADQPGVDLDLPAADRDRLHHMSRSLEKLEAENRMLRAAGGRQGGDSDSRVLQLEKENAFLKNKIKQLEDVVSQQEQQLRDSPAIAADLQRKLQEASELSGQLSRLAMQQQQQQQQQQRKF